MLKPCLTRFRSPFESRDRWQISCQGSTSLSVEQQTPQASARQHPCSIRPAPTGLGEPACRAARSLWPGPAIGWVIGGLSVRARRRGWNGCQLECADLLDCGGCCCGWVGSQVVASGGDRQICSCSVAMVGDVSRRSLEANSANLLSSRSYRGVIAENLPKE